MTIGIDQVRNEPRFDLGLNQGNFTLAAAGDVNAQGNTSTVSSNSSTAGALVASSADPAASISGPATEFSPYTLAPNATVLAVKTPAGLAALLIPNDVVVGEVATRIAQGDLQGALAASPDLLTRSTLFVSMPNPTGGPNTVMTMPLNGSSAPEFGAANNSFSTIANGTIIFNNTRGRADGNTVSNNAGFITPINGSDGVATLLANAIRSAAARNNNVTDPDSLVDDGLAALAGEVVKNSTTFYAGLAWRGSISQEGDDIVLNAFNTRVELDPSQLAEQATNYIQGRSTLPGSGTVGGDDGSFPVADYATDAVFEGIGAAAALRGGPFSALPYGVSAAFRLGETLETAALDAGVAAGLYKVDTAMLVNDVRNGAVNNGDTAVGIAAIYSDIIDRALERGVNDADANQIRAHLSRALNYVGQDERETALVRLMAASVLGDKETIDRSNATLQALDRNNPGGPPRAPSDIATYGRTPDQTVGEYIAPQTQSTELTKDFDILDTTFDRLGGRGSATGWTSRVVGTSTNVDGTAPDGTEREVRLGMVQRNDGSSQFVALRGSGNAAYYELPPEVRGDRAKAEAYIEQAIASGAMNDSRVTDQARNTVDEILDAPLENGAAEADRVGGLWNRFLDSNPNSDLFVLNDFLVDRYNENGLTPTQKANIENLYYQPEFEPARILNGTIFGTEDGKISIPRSAEGGENVLSANEIAPAFRAMRERVGEAEYQRRVNEAAEQLYEAGWPLNFGVPELAQALSSLERERGPATLDPAFEEHSHRYRP